MQPWLKQGLKANQDERLHKERLKKVNGSIGFWKVLRLKKEIYYRWDQCFPTASTQMVFGNSSDLKKEGKNEQYFNIVLVQGVTLVIFCGIRFEFEHIYTSIHWVLYNSGAQVPWTESRFLHPNKSCDKKKKHNWMFFLNRSASVWMRFLFSSLF